MKLTSVFYKQKGAMATIALATTVLVMLVPGLIMEPARPVHDILGQYDPGTIAASDWGLYGANLGISSPTPVPNYVVRLNLPASFNYGACLAGGDDIRFFDAVNTSLSYWIESWVVGGISTIWIKIPVTGTNQITMRYGKASAPAASSGVSTFQFFDDFTGSSLNASKWTSYTDTYSTMSVSGGLLHVVSDTPSDWIAITLVGFHDTTITSGAAFGTNYNNGIRLGTMDTVATQVAGVQTTTTHALSNRTFTAEIKWINSSRAEFYDNDALFATHTTNVPPGPLPLRLLTGDREAGPGTHYGAYVTSVNTSIGVPGKAMRMNYYTQQGVTGVVSRSDYNWVFVRSVVANDPVAYINNFVPTLTSGKITPTTGSQATPFNFSVTFTDGDNIAPDTIWVNVNGAIHSLAKTNPSDLIYSDGCRYSWMGYLQPGSYSYYFRCQQGALLVSTTTWSNLTVTETNSFTPQLLNTAFTPSIGKNTTTFTFTTEYRDADNNHPDSININIGAAVVPMIEVNPADTNAMDGKVYRYQTTLDWGDYIFKIDCFDGARSNTTGWLPGPVVDPFYRFHNQTLFSDNFESGLAKWSTVTGAWHVSNPAGSYNAYRSPTHSVWCGSEATGLYPNSHAAELVSMPIDVSIVDSAYLEFFHYQTTEAGWDYCAVYVRQNAGAWIQLYRVAGNVAWEKRTYNLSSYCGPGNTIEIRFYFTSDPTVNYRGWYVDDVQVYTNKIPVLSTLVNPANSSSVFTGNNEFEWTNVEYTDLPINYTLQIATSSAFTTVLQQIEHIPETSGTTTTVVSIANTGTQWWRVRATVNNMNDTWSAPFTFTATLAPEAYITSPLNQTYASATCTLTLTGNPSTNSIIYNVFNHTSMSWKYGTNQTYVGSGPLSLSEGVFTIYAWGRTASLFVQQVPTTRTLTIDVTSPVVTILAPSNNTTYSTSTLGIDVTAIDTVSPISRIWFNFWDVDLASWVYGTNQSFTGYTTRSLADGAYRFFAWANDSVNHVSSARHEININTLAPVVDNPTDFLFMQNQTSVYIQWTITEVFPDDYRVLRNGVQIISWTPYLSGVPVDVAIDTNIGLGIWNYTILYRDAFGMNGVPDTVLITVNDYPWITAPPADRMVIQNATGETILWTILDSYPGTGLWEVFLEGTPFIGGSFNTGIPVSAPIYTNIGTGTWNYTIEYIDAYGYFGIQDTVLITITGNPIATSAPLGGAVVLQNSTYQINWTLTSPAGPGQYRVLRNGSTIVGWSPWGANPASIGVLVNTNGGLRFFNYTIEFNSSTGLYGNPNTVIIAVNDVPAILLPPGDVIVLRNATSQTISWTIIDVLTGTGPYMIFRNSANITGVLFYTSGVPVSIGINTNIGLGTFIYTIMYGDMFGTLGTNDSVNVVVNDVPIANTPFPDRHYAANETGQTMQWVITDGIGGTGQYVVRVNGTIYTSGTWWSGVTFLVPVNTNMGFGMWEYTVAYNDTYNQAGLVKTVTVYIEDIPRSTHPANQAVLVNSPGHVITWTITDATGPGYYRVLRNSSIVVVNWASWVVGMPFNAPIQTAVAYGTWRYTLEYNNSAGRIGTSDDVDVLVEDLPVATPSGSPPDTYQNVTAGPVISWTITDRFGSGFYRILRNTTSITGWLPWINNVVINQVVSTIAGIGSFAYTIQYNDSNGFTGTANTIMAKILQDTAAPGISDPTIDALQVFSTPVTVTCNVTETQSGVGTVRVFYSVNGTSSFTPVAMSFVSGAMYSGQIPTQGVISTVYYYFQAVDRAGNARVENNASSYYMYHLNFLPPGAYVLEFMVPVHITVNIVVETSGRITLASFIGATVQDALNMSTTTVAFNLAFTGGVFTSMTITAYFTGGQYTAADLVVFHEVDGTWYEVTPSSINVVGGSITFPVASLSRFVVGIRVTTGFDIIQFLKDNWLLVVLIMVGAVLGITGAAVASRRKKSVAKASGQKAMPGKIVMTPAWMREAKLRALNTPPKQPEVVAKEPFHLYCACCEQWIDKQPTAVIVGRETCAKCKQPLFFVPKCDNCGNALVKSVQIFNEFRQNPRKCEKCGGNLRIQ
nr:DUF2341 domain-containing protein [Candidatus Sigynarchaeota archaeon]